VVLVVIQFLEVELEEVELYQLLELLEEHMEVVVVVGRVFQSPAVQAVAVL
jgi:hypothetical protein